VNESPLSDEFLRLLQPCQSRLFGYLYAMLHNLSDTEDALQQAIMALWAHFDEYDRQRNFLNWATQFVKLTAMSSLRARRRRRVTFDHDLVALIADDCSPAAEEASMLDGYRETLLGCMDRLAPADRDLIRLCYFERCTIKAVADRLGRAPQSVCNSLRRIRGALFDCIQDAVDSEDRR
jgi:RNA polymerase sigma-70 factor (ECF subfamily)